MGEGPVGDLGESALADQHFSHQNQSLVWSSGFAVRPPGSGEPGRSTTATTRCGPTKKVRVSNEQMNVELSFLKIRGIRVLDSTVNLVAALGKTPNEADLKDITSLHALLSELGGKEPGGLNRR